MSDFFNCRTLDVIESNLLVAGIPWDFSSSFRRGSAAAPPLIRQATTSDLYNSFTESMINLTEKWKIFDCGDIEESEDVNLVRNLIYERIKENTKHHSVDNFLFLGGDHLSTYFSFLALSKLGMLDENVGILYLDAHPDLYDSYEGNKYSHACVLRRIIDETIIKPKDIVHFGIRAASSDQVKFAKEENIRMITCSEFRRNPLNEIIAAIKERFSTKKKIYLSVDLDILDPSFAPGLGNPEPGGLSTSEVVNFIQEISDLPIFAFDVVEYNPKYDHSMISAYAAAKIIKEILGIMPMQLN